MNQAVSIWRRQAWVCVWLWFFVFGVSVSICLRASTPLEYRAETAREYLRSVAQAIEQQEGAEAGVCFILARLLDQLGDKSKAEELARRALTIDPTRAEVHSFLAGLYILQDRMDEAARCLREAIKLRPDSARDHRQLGMVLDRSGNRKEAQTLFERAIVLAPHDATAQMLLGRLMLDQGQVKEAVVHLEKACQLDPSLAGAHYALSQAQTRLGETSNALNSLHKYKELRQKEKAALDAQNAAIDNVKGMAILAAGFHTELAGYYIQGGRVGEAEAHLRQSIQIAPNEARGYEMLSTILAKEGRLADARQVCEQMVRIWPGQAAYRANLGSLLFQLREPALAVEELKRALVLDPRQSVALANLARFFLSTSQEIPKALEMCQRLVESQPTAPHYDLLGWAYYANGRTNEARVAAGHAVELDPGNAGYRERHKRLEKGP